MNPRERTLAFLLVGVVIAAGLGALGYFLYWTPLAERDRRIASLSKDIEKRENEIRQIQADLPRLERWKQLSLPGDVDLARREYERYLTGLLRESGFAPGTYTVTPPRTVDPKSSPSIPGKGPVYVRLTYKVQAPVALGRLVTFLERFYHTAALHQVRGLTLKRTTTAGRTNELDVELTIEALVLAGPETRARPAAYAAAGAAAWAVRPANRAAPATSLAVPPRDYEQLANHNVFLGTPPPAADLADRTPVTRVIFLTGITRGPDTTEATVFYPYYRRDGLKVRPAPGEDEFPILQDARGRSLVEGVVLRIDERDVYFRVRLAAEDEPARDVATAEGWYPPEKKTLEFLLREQAIRPEEAGRVFQTSRAYWDQLDREDLVDVRDREFAFRWDLVCGRVLRADDRSVVILVDEKYCAYRSLAGPGNRFRRRTTPHEGYYVFHVGTNLDEAMETPLSEEQVKELKAAALPKRPDDVRR